ncbi:MAG: ATP-grasp domain-containing protein [Nitrospiraceae bacterium]
MPRLLLLLPTTTYRAEAFLEAAQRLNLDVAVGTEGVPALAKQESSAVLPLDFRHVEDSVRKAVEFSLHHPIDAVLGVDDHTAILAAHISAALGLLHNSVASVAAAGNKHRMRSILHQQGVPVPRFAVFPIDGDPAAFASQVACPCVLKPLILSASCGVIRANDEQEFVGAFRRVATLLRGLGMAEREDGGRQILVEDFVQGRELALEGLLTDGQLRLLALFDKPDPLDGPFFEETIYVTPSRLPTRLQQDIVTCAARAANALGLREGPVHGEFRVNDRGVWVIEMAARSIGGRCSQTLRFAADMSLEELLLRHALRMDIPSFEREKHAAGVMMLPISYGGILREVRGQAEARAVQGIEELTITVQPGQELVPLPEGTRYLGFLMARADSPEAVEVSLREAYRRLDVVVSAVPTGRLGHPAQAGKPHVVTF